MNKLNSRSKAISISTFDFFTLYSNSPHDKLKLVIGELINFCFNGGDKEFIGIIKYGGDKEFIGIIKYGGDKEFIGIIKYGGDKEFIGIIKYGGDKEFIGIIKYGGDKEFIGIIKDGANWTNYILFRSFFNVNEFAVYFNISVIPN